MVAVNGLLIFLPIPFGNSIPAFAMMLMALGMMLGDGVAILSGILVSQFKPAATDAEEFLFVSVSL